jgi:hypothetical protein
MVAQVGDVVKFTGYNVQASFKEDFRVPIGTAGIVCGTGVVVKGVRSTMTRIQFAKQPSVVDLFDGEFEAVW